MLSNAWTNESPGNRNANRNEPIEGKDKCVDGGDVSVEAGEIP